MQLGDKISLALAVVGFVDIRTDAGAAADDLLGQNGLLMLLFQMLS